MQIRLVKADGVFELIQCPESGEAWLGLLEDKQPDSDFVGLILPLEMARPGGGKRQFLFGLELLEWLRWSAPDQWPTLPVLALAWQSLECILRRRPTLLLTTPGTEFGCAADEEEVCKDFAERCREDYQSKEFSMNFDVATLPSLAAGDFAGKTHHDMANMHYGANRLWVGYKSIIEEFNVGHARDKVELEILKGKPPISPVETSLFRTPWFRQWQKCNLHACPKYPDIYDARNPVIMRHCMDNRGVLPEDVRILLVDDEFDKGFDAVLLAMLFGSRLSEGKDVFRRDGELVYAPLCNSLNDSPERRVARFVCARDAELAKYWLTGWSDIPFDDSDLQPTDTLEVEKFKLHFKWAKEWCRKEKALFSAEYSACTVLDEIFAEVNPQKMFFDLNGRLGTEVPGRMLQNLGVGKPPHGDQRKMKTVVLLDLHLTRTPAALSTFDPKYLPSLQLRKELKEKKKEQRVPVIFFTSSRNVANYLPALTAGSQLDGWFPKEAPDVPEDDDNSGRSAAYLLDRIYNARIRDDAPAGVKGVFDNERIEGLYAILEDSSEYDKLSSAALKICNNPYALLSTDSYLERVEKALNDQQISVPDYEGVILVGRLLVLAKMLELSHSLKVKGVEVKKGLNCKENELNQARLGFSTLAKLTSLWKNDLFEQERMWLRAYAAGSQSLSDKVKDLDRVTKLYGSEAATNQSPIKTQRLAGLSSPLAVRTLDEF
jgi:hypothetical protein